MNILPLFLHHKYFLTSKCNFINILYLSPEPCKNYIILLYYIFQFRHKFNLYICMPLTLSMDNY